MGWKKDARKSKAKQKRIEKQLKPYWELLKAAKLRRAKAQEAFLLAEGEYKTARGDLQRIEREMREIHSQ